MAQKAGTKPALKILILGDSRVGKTTLLDIHYGSGTMDPTLAPSVGVNVHRMELEVLKDKCIIEILDTPGREEFRSACSSSYPGCKACILMFSHDDPASFANLAGWHQDVLNYVHPAPPFIVVGNKNDLMEHVPRISVGHVRFWCGERGMSYFETGLNHFDRIASVFEDAFVKAKMFWYETERNVL